MPAWASLPVGVVYKGGDDLPPCKSGVLLQTSLRKDTSHSEDEVKQKQPWQQGHVVTKNKALTPEGPPQRLPRDTWKDKQGHSAWYNKSQEPENAQKVWSPGSGRGKCVDSEGNTRGLRGGRPSKAQNLLSRELASDNQAPKANHRALLSHEVEASKIFAQLCCAEKQTLDAMDIRTQKNSEDCHSPSTRAPSPSSPVRGWDLTPPSKRERIHSVVLKTQDEASSPKDDMSEKNAEEEAPQAAHEEAPQATQEDD